MKIPAGAAQRSAARLKLALRRIQSKSEARWDDFRMRHDSPLQLAIFDDVFPQHLSAFRISEFNAYLSHYKRTAIYSSSTAFRTLNETRSLKAVIADYEKRYPQFANKIFSFNPSRRVRAQIAYTMMLSNADRFLPVLTRCNLPFVCTLYPGGGFCLGEKASDEALKRVCGSPLLRKMVVTQKITRQYLLDQGLLDAAQIEFVYGGVFPADRLADSIVEKKLYGHDKQTLDVCFVAHKYMAGGIDKGYDVFVDVAHILCRERQDVHFHVVGPYDETDLDVSALNGRIHFYGQLQTEQFPAFYSGMDAILSPNVPFLLNPGAFDGFPTGCCIEAALCGVAVFCTDPLQQNIVFENEAEIVIVPHDAGTIAESLSGYFNAYSSMCELARQGQKAFQRVFDIDAQMGPRLLILSQFMNS